jgi:hypothetical protein
MRSIWSKSYTPFDKSNPFFIKNSSEKANTVANTFGMCKTISNKQASQNESLKRKIEQIDLEDSSSSSSDALTSSASSSITSNSYDSNSTVKNEKKFKPDTLKPDLDELISSYSMSSSSVTLDETAEIKHEFSSYFSSTKATSPILNKVYLIC